MNAESISARVRRATRAVGGLLVAFGACVMVGWLTGATTLVQLLPSMVPVQFNTALGLFVCGVGLLAVGSRARPLAVAAGLLLACLGLTTLVQYVSGAELGIDELFVDHTLVVGTSHPGRMAPNTAFCFVLLSLVFLGHVGFPTARGSAARAVVAAVTTALATVALVGYVAGLESAYGWGQLTRMALQTSLALVLLGTTLIAMEWSARSRRPGGPVWLPVIAAAALATVALCLAQALAEQDERRLNRSVERTAEAMARGIERRLEMQIDQLGQLADRWVMLDGLRREEWNLDARYFARVEPGLVAIEWVDESYRTRWIAPETHPAADAGHDERLREVIESARRTGEPRFGPAFDPAGGGGEVFLLAIPLDGDATDGAIVGVYRPDALVRAVASDMRLRGVGLSVSDAGREIVREGGSDRARRARSSEVAVAGLRWNVEVRPGAGLVAAERSVLPWLTVIVGLVIAVLAAATIRASQRALANLARLRGANVKLEREIADRRRAEAAAIELAATLERRVAAAVAESERRAAELQASNADLEQFAYVASHDLQEPLRAVSGFCQLLARRYRDALDETAASYVDEILAGSSRMQRMIRDLLAYSRVGRASLGREPVDCRTVVEEACANLRMAIDEAGATVLTRGLPTIPGDRGQLEQLLRNLLGNAVKYRSERPPRVTVSAERDGDVWSFAVSDNGIGIDERHHARIFDIFQRLHTREEYPGTGIGLAICRRIVERLGGRIRIESEAGRGTTVRFTLPCSDEDVVPESERGDRWRPVTVAPVEGDVAPVA